MISTAGSNITRSSNAHNLSTIVNDSYKGAAARFSAETSQEGSELLS